MIEKIRQRKIHYVQFGATPVSRETLLQRIREGRYETQCTKCSYDKEYLASTLSDLNLVNQIKNTSEKTLVFIEI